MLQNGAKNGFSSTHCGRKIVSQTTYLVQIMTNQKNSSCVILYLIVLFFYETHFWMAAWETIFLPQGVQAGLKDMPI